MQYNQKESSTGFTLIGSCLSSVCNAYNERGKYARHAERLGLSGKTVPALAIEKINEGLHFAFDETLEVTEKAVGDWVTKFLNGDLSPTIKSEEIPADNSGPVKIVVAKNFDQIVMDSTKDVLLEFYAPCIYSLFFWHH
jgi:protein disulfide-isomerase A1